ncbi:MAG: endonuclease III domain-containing protein [Syntrophobacterales bacterium]|nr:MAG: endonuclease III domain-containing protein [Syntrophobacterales bacterium]
MRAQERLDVIYEVLNAYFGDLHWWPGETPFEITVGAILTQNTNWKNVETAIGRLKEANLLDPLKLYDTEDSIVAGLIRSSGYYNLKTKRLKEFLDFLHNEYDGDLDAMFNEELWTLREKLLDVRGIGGETADSILLYGAGKPVFVVDAYTRRVLERHDLITPDWSYQEIQSLFMDRIPHDIPLYKQYHALLVLVGKQFCKKNPLCRGCPLENEL